MTPPSFPTDIDPRPAFAEVASVATLLIGGVRTDQLDLATPAGMSVVDLLGHLVMVGRRVACAGRGDHPSTWPGDLPSSWDGSAVDFRNGGWVEAWAAARDEGLGAWTSDSVLTRETALPWTVTSGAETLAVYVNEVLVHTWDLAQATGGAPTWSGTTINIADLAIRAQLPMADRGPMWEQAKQYVPAGIAWEDPFGNAVDVDPGASAVDRLVAWNGRRP
jgi:uncharacterized protein (TIGR03086 family)